MTRSGVQDRLSQRTQLVGTGLSRIDMGTTAPCWTAKSWGPPQMAVAPRFSPTVGLAFRQDPGVEVAGIEPASYDASPGLLRAQSAVSLLGPTGRTD